MTTKLLSFPPSLDCELVRFLFAHYEVQYTEERHALLFSFWFTWRTGHTLLFPLVLDGAQRLNHARQVVDAFDPRAPQQRRLLREGSESEQLERDWLRFNKNLGIATAIFGYYHLLKHRDIMLRPLSEGTPDLERRSVELAYPLYANTLRAVLRLTSTRAQAALDSVHKVADEVDRRLSDRNAYLVGKRFSLSDMAFAVSLAPLVLPESYGSPLPSLVEMPAPMRSAIEEMRQRPCGQFAMRIYAEHRQGPRKETAPTASKRTRASSRNS